MRPLPLAEMKEGAARWRAVLDVASAVALLVASCLAIWSLSFGGFRLGSAREARRALPGVPLGLSGAQFEGAPSAPVGIVAFSDFQCPYCITFAKKILPVLRTAYLETGKVRFAFRHLPLETLHSQAVGAAIASECAGQQGRFSQMHDILFDRQLLLDPQNIRAQANELGLNVAEFAKCQDGPDVLTRIQQDINLAQELKVNSTPTFFVGMLAGDRLTVTARIDGARPLEIFESSIKTALEAKR